MGILPSLGLHSAPRPLGQRIQTSTEELLEMPPDTLVAYLTILSWHMLERQTFTLLHFLRQTRSREASNPRDKIYSLLGPLLSVALKPDYHLSMSQIYCLVTHEIIIRHQNLDNLMEPPSFKQPYGNPSLQRLYTVIAAEPPHFHDLQPKLISPATQQQILVFTIYRRLVMCIGLNKATLLM